MDQLVIDQIKKVILKHGAGWCFSSHDFSSLGADPAIRQALSRLQRRKFIRRVAWGFMTTPEGIPFSGNSHPIFSKWYKPLPWRSQMNVSLGAYAANLLGLSDHVPGKLVYLTDGPSKSIQIGNQSVVFKKTTPKNLSAPDPFGGLVVQALRFLGKNHMDDHVIQILKDRLKGKDRNSILRARASAPVWVSRILTNVAGDTAHG